MEIPATYDTGKPADGTPLVTAGGFSSIPASDSAAQISPALEQILLPGTDADIVARYATLSRRAKTAAFGLFEEDVVVVDTETTGLRYDTDELIEISAARLKGSKVTDDFCTYVNPGRSIPHEIAILTSITDKKVADAPGPREAVGLFAKFAGGSALIAHNASFDRNFIMRYAMGGLTGAWIDTLELARIALPRLRSHSLDLLAKAFGAPAPTHDATDDVAALVCIWRVLLVALSDLPAGLLDMLVHLRGDTPWGLRSVIAQVAASSPSHEAFDLKTVRTARVRADRAPAKEDADGRGMLFPTRSEVAAGFARGRVVGAMYPRYEQRDQQVAMAREVVGAFADSTHRAIEAGTGVGKSIAYLYPAALVAQRNNITVGVSTRTNALMDQLVFGELPQLAGALAQAPGATNRPPLRYCALKGYDHYPCLRKLERLAFEPPTGDFVADSAALTMVATLFAFVAQSSWGDLDSVPLFWPGLPRDQIVCTPHDCLRQRCPFFPHRCYLHGVRQRAKFADIVVTNHALLFRNIIADNGILPAIRYWIVDEAHSVESEARRQLSPNIVEKDLDHMLARLEGPGGPLRTISRKASGLEGGSLLQGLVAKARTATEVLKVVSKGFWGLVKDLSALGERTTYDQMDLWISSDVRETRAWGAAVAGGQALHKRLENLNKALSDLISRGEQLSFDLSGEIADLVAASSQLYDMQTALGVVIDGGNSNYVYSAHVDRRPEARAEYLQAGLIDVGEALAEAFYPEVHSVVYTSATIATAARSSATPDDQEPFAHFAQTVGLDRLECGMWQALRLESGYDLEHHMTIYVPNDLPEPTDRFGYLPTLESFLVQVHAAMGGSVLTLFTNRREMERAYDDLCDELRAQGTEAICQRRGSSARRLRDEFIDDEHLSLFALRSFWEGFDAPGDTLRCVVVVKLPFSRPSDPLSQERKRRDSASWGHYVLPEAVLDFKQACGRLIRSSTDTGCLVLPDRRLITKRYGSSFLNALPQARRIIATGDQVVQDMRAHYGRP